MSSISDVFGTYHRVIEGLEGGYGETLLDADDGLAGRIAGVPHAAVLAQIAETRAINGHHEFQSIELEASWMAWADHDDALSDALVYWTAPDICAVIDHAGHYLPPTYRLTIEDVPGPRGFVTLAEPVLLFEVNPILDGGELPNLLRIGAISWERFAPGVLIRFYDMRGDRYSQWLSQNYAIEWRMIGERGTNHVIDQALRWLCAFWLFIRQDVPAVRSISTSRIPHRIADRDPVTTATIMTLRRSTTDHGGESDVEWSHRWMVSGHWRQQYYPATDEHHTIWIAPHVKGPESMPLVLKERGFAVTR